MIPRDECIEEQNELFILAQCQTDTCSYIFKVEGKRIITLPPNIIYSYIVGKYNKEMKFEVEASENNSYMTISIIGDADLSIDKK